MLAGKPGENYRCDEALCEEDIEVTVVNLEKTCVLEASSVLCKFSKCF